MKSNIEKALAVGGAAVAVTAAVTGVSIAAEQNPPATVTAVVSVLSGVEHADLAQLMDSDDSVLANAVRAVRNVSLTDALAMNFNSA